MMNTETGPPEPPPIVSKPEKFWGVRHTQYVLLLVAMVIGFGIRCILNVAVIAMISDDPPNGNIPTYPEWTSKKNVMLSSFLWGYVCFQVGAGQIAKNYGAKLFLGGAIFINSLFTALVPVFGAQFGYGGVIACRVIQGMSQGFLFPSIHTLLSSWTPIYDRAKVGSFVYAGSPLGNVLAMPLTGSIAASSVGWPVVFYLYGALGMAWSLAWVFLGSNSPSTYKNISAEEKEYIEAGLPTEEKESVPTPWKSILKSLPFWAILVSHTGQAWGFWTLLAETPSYMENILGYKIAANSYLSALPYFVQWVLSFFLSPIADWTIVKNIFSRRVSRKLFNCIGMFSSGIALLILNFVGNTQKVLTIVILVFGVGFNAGVLSGFQVNHIDISPVHAGTLMALTNTAATILSILAPLTVDAIKSISGYEETDKPLWNMVFSLAAGIYIVAGIFFMLAAAGEVQPWDNLETRKNSNREIKNHANADTETEKGL